jgi:hypothetical protein
MHDRRDPRAAFHDDLLLLFEAYRYRPTVASRRAYLYFFERDHVRLIVSFEKLHSGECRVGGFAGERELEPLIMRVFLGTDVATALRHIEEYLVTIYESEFRDSAVVDVVFRRID